MNENDQYRSEDSKSIVINEVESSDQIAKENKAIEFGKVKQANDFVD